MKRRVLAVCLVLFIPAVLGAASVAQVTFTELVNSSELIFEGRVVGKRVAVDSRGMIHTYVTFEVQDILKGRHSGSTIELRYLGGTAGGLSLRVSDLVLPAANEKGVYFVESVTRPQAHPLYGWDQGHFIVTTTPADPTERVLSRTGKPITGVESAPAKADGLSTGIASGLSVADTGRPGEAMTVRDFKQKIVELRK